MLRCSRPTRLNSHAAEADGLDPDARQGKFLAHTDEDSYFRPAAHARMDREQAAVRDGLPKGAAVHRDAGIRVLRQQVCDANAATLDWLQVLDPGGPISGELQCMPHQVQLEWTLICDGIHSR